MQKKLRRPKSKAKQQKAPKPKCPMCSKGISLHVNLKEALSRKYSSSQSHYYLAVFEKIDKDKVQPQEEYLEQYYKGLNRRHCFNRIKQVYKMHSQIPRIFQPNIKQILNKCYHRKRLIEYFQMARLFKLPVESIKFSTFLLSMTQEPHKNRHNNYEPLIGKISKYDFSQELEKNLLETMEGHRWSENPELTP